MLIKKIPTLEATSHKWKTQNAKLEHSKRPTHSSLQFLHDLLHTVIHMQLACLQDQFRMVGLLILLVNTSESCHTKKPCPDQWSAKLRSYPQPTMCTHASRLLLTWAICCKFPVWCQIGAHTSHSKSDTGCKTIPSSKQDTCSRPVRTLDFACPSLGIESLHISLLTHLQRGVHKAFNEGQASLLVQLSCLVSVLPGD